MRELPWYAWVIVGLVILLVFYMLWLKPKMQTLNTTRENRIKIEREVQTLRAKKRQMDKIEREIAELDKTLKALETMMPKQRELSDIIKRFQQLAFDSRLTITKFNPGGEINREFFLEWPIVFEVQGNYHNLDTFFDKLSRFSRIFVIDEFSVKGLRRQSDPLTITANIIAKTFVSIERSGVQQ